MCISVKISLWKGSSSFGRVCLNERELSCRLGEWLILGDFAIWTVIVLEKVVLYWLWVPREMNSRCCSKTQWQMFMLVSGRHVGAHPDVHQHSVSIQSSINLSKSILKISRIRKIALTWILAWVLTYLPPFIFRFLDLIYGSVSINGVTVQTN